MKTIVLLLLLLLLAGAAAYFYPPWHEHAPNACAALETRLTGLVSAQLKAQPGGGDPRIAGVIGALSAAAPTGVIAGAYVRDTFPFLPPDIGCVAAYWRTVADPDIAQYARGALGLRAPR